MTTTTDSFKQSSETGTSPDRFLVRSGRFLFRYRSLLFPLIFVSILVVLRPRVVVSEAFYSLVLAAGFLITLAGEGVRVLTIGLDYIERGGKNKQPWASRLVTRGFYNHVRNPMYVGNLLIALGIGLYSGAPLALVTVLPFFLWVYIAIISAEENFLRQNFGQEYADYMKRVPRLIPRLSGIGGAFKQFTFNWRRVLAKDNGTAYWTFLALTLLPVWRHYFLTGHLVWPPALLVLAALLTVAYAVVRTMAKKGRLGPV